MHFLYLYLTQNIIRLEKNIVTYVIELFSITFIFYLYLLIDINYKECNKPKSKTKLFFTYICPCAKLRKPTSIAEKTFLTNYFWLSLFVITSSNKKLTAGTNTGLRCAQTLQDKVYLQLIPNSIHARHHLL